MERLDISSPEEGYMVAIFLLALFFADTDRPIAVCDIRSQRGRVTIRGVGGISRDGPALCDYTCPLSTDKGFVLPRSVLIVTGDVLQQDPHLSRLKVGDIFQAVIEGQIECREPMSYRRSDDGEIVGGSGFGSLGLFNCRMKNVRVRAMHSLSDEWGLIAPSGKR
jgi:hypothetical protein